jgi:3D (Asp-Asp-Asp) domain-containing protein
VMEISQKYIRMAVLYAFLLSFGAVVIWGELVFLKNRFEEIDQKKELLRENEIVYISEKAKKEVSRTDVSVKYATLNFKSANKYSLLLPRWSIVKEKKSVPFSVYRKYTTSLPYGATKTEPGKPGEVEIYWRVYKRGNEVLEKQKFKEVVLSEPRHQIVYVGRGYMLASRGNFAGKPYLDMIATAYDPGVRSCGRYADGYTSLGLKAGYGVVAVDPSVIPLRKKLYVEGYGYAIAGDVGSAIKGLKIDLGFDTYREAINFGVRRVRVYILD